VYSTLISITQSNKTNNTEKVLPLKKIFALLLILVFGIASLALAAPANASSENGNGHTPVTFCHNGNLITTDENGLNGHENHPNDVFPVDGQELTQEDCGTPIEEDPVVVQPPVVVAPPVVVEPPVVEVPVSDPPISTPIVAPTCVPGTGELLLADSPLTYTGSSYPVAETPIFLWTTPQRIGDTVTVEAYLNPVFDGIFVLVDSSYTTLFGNNAVFTINCPVPAEVVPSPEVPVNPVPEVPVAPEPAAPVSVPSVVNAPTEVVSAPTEKAETVPTEVVPAPTEKVETVPAAQSSATQPTELAYTGAEEDRLALFATIAVLAIAAGVGVLQLGNKFA
jgi:hypothetical protein